MTGPWRVERTVMVTGLSPTTLMVSVRVWKSTHLPSASYCLGLSGIDLFDEQVHHIRAGVGEAPGDIVVVADDHARHAGEGKAAIS